MVAIKHHQNLTQVFLSHIKQTYGALSAICCIPSHADESKMVLDLETRL
jgi:hypothetical protein